MAMASATLPLLVLLALAVLAQADPVAVPHLANKLFNSSSSSSSAPAAAAPAPPAGLVSRTNGTGSYKGMPREFVNLHNKLRARYGVPPMRWDNKLARQARRWSDAMRGECVLRHSNTKFGESLFIGRDGWNATASDAVNTWAGEERIYDRQTGRCTGGRHFRECGHFAFMVRPRFSRIGCARADCFKGGVFITCNYYFD
ncbi:hypothetical protein E2562_036800 [Oryza meyeriana var. granulata]|uniref:SCP domain-containing protein n=1 Tax=Oryza meyeriana var. granulata TaxID=110450 RepID=A0A6G1ETF3_9ORYZ|nr:hypothetical protein E2562_036800 [Oryza meyeriana var. granulata]